MEKEKDFGELLQKDTAIIVAMQLDPESFINLSVSNKRFYDWIRQDENFWLLKTTKDFPFLLESKKENTWKNLYLDTVRYISKLKEKYDYDYFLRDKIWDTENPKEIYNKIGKRLKEAKKEYEALGNISKAVKKLKKGEFLSFPGLLLDRSVIEPFFRKWERDYSDVVQFLGKERISQLYENIMRMKTPGLEYSDTLFEDIITSLSK